MIKTREKLYIICAVCSHFIVVLFPLKDISRFLKVERKGRDQTKDMYERPWTWKTVCGLTVGVGGGMGGGGQKGKNWNNGNRITIKMI